MKKLFISTAFIAAGAWAAATLDPAGMIDRGWQLKRGTTNVGLPHLTMDACRTALLANVESRRASANYTCANTWAARGLWTPDAPPPPPPPPPPPDTGMMPFVNAANIPAPAVGFDTDRINSTSNPGPSSDGTGNFRTVCDFSHMNFDDPIVYPGQPGRSHLHTFFGNTGANGNSTINSIATTGNSTCRGGTVNRSSYWVPSVIDTRTGTPIKPTTSNFYYKNGAINPALIQPVPLGLRMIAGDAKMASPGGMHVMNCNGEYGPMEGNAIPACPAGAEVWQAIDFPQCWDGVNLDSPDHKSHMAFPVRNACPASHPVALPAISFIIIYPVTAADAPSQWRLSSDNYSTSLPGGYSFHADWFNGWRPDIKDQFTRNCINPGNDCGSHMLGNGQGIY